ncbi:hypothetical protein GQ602_005817 [Ophiocordyceps camponoti-floridani]|uniref:Uncharacterized protein n=1 Tax=Ophiocordyceps camponoti-floridani TaxID=2030778 RepID=A0A8H4Q473_9HYPO|nr:hypothetical protein GQ602_005817 [Ophiocordyceps camponoti-floridani]
MKTLLHLFFPIFSIPALAQSIPPISLTPGLTPGLTPAIGLTPPIYNNQASPQPTTQHRRPRPLPPLPRQGLLTPGIPAGGAPPAAVGGRLPPPPTTTTSPPPPPPLAAVPPVGPVAPVPVAPVPAVGPKPGGRTGTIWRISRI